MTTEEQAKYFTGCHNSFQHYYPEGEPDCIFCGGFGPIEGFEPCMPREEIGRTMELFVKILRGMGILDEVSKRFSAERTPEEGDSGDASYRPEKRLALRRCDLRTYREDNQLKQYTDFGTCLDKAEREREEQ